MVVLAIEVFVVGALALYLLTVVPAGLITAVKGNSRSFGWGFLSFGLTWYGGAMRLAPPDSLWARHRYDDEQRRLAGLPLARQRSSRLLLAWLLAAISAAVLLGAFIARPAPVLGVNGRALERSMPREPFPGPSSCVRLGNSSWSCPIEPAERSGGSLSWRVVVGDRGCWVAYPGPVSRSSHEGRMSGCIHLFDYL